MQPEQIPKYAGGSSSEASDRNIFKLHAPFEPTGDQPQAIEELVKGFKRYMLVILLWFVLQRNKIDYII